MLYYLLHCGQMYIVCISSFTLRKKPRTLSGHWLTLDVARVYSTPSVTSAESCERAAQFTEVRSVPFLDPKSSQYSGFQCLENERVHMRAKQGLKTALEEQAKVQHDLMDANASWKFDRRYRAYCQWSLKITLNWNTNMKGRVAISKIQYGTHTGPSSGR